MKSRRHPATLLAAFVTAMVLACTAAASADAKSCRGAHWVGAWAASPSDGNAGPFADQTLRMNVTPLLAGSTLRVRLSNRFGRRAVTFDSTYIGKQQSGAALVPGSNRPVLFHGRRKVRIPPGREMKSDRVRLSFSAFEQLAVSLYARKDTGNATRHFQAAQTSYVTVGGAGNHAGEEGGDAFIQPVKSRYFVSAIDVRAPKSTSAVVTFGDSITDGYQAGPNFPRNVFSQGGIDEDARYPDFLARRLARAPRRSFSVLNAGIAGNRVLEGDPKNIFGPSALSRIRSDVRTLKGVTDVIVLEGINDLATVASAQALIGGLRKLVRGLERMRPRRHRLKVLIGTLLPSSGALNFTHGTAAVNAARERVNRFIRSSGIGGGIVDFDAALRDPADPARLNPAFDSGDHLHPSSAGYRRMAEAVNLSLLDGPRCEPHRR